MEHYLVMKKDDVLAMLPMDEPGKRARGRRPITDHPPEMPFP